MSNTPVVSVCVLTYNHGKYIAQCLDSILAQKTNFDFKIIIGEDNSPDNTRDICIEYANKYPDKIVLILRERDTVVYIGNMATGRYNFISTINSSESKYVAICEGDDYWIDPLKLQVQYDILEANPSYSLSGHNAYIIYEDNPRIGRVFNPKNPGNILTINDVLKNKMYIPTASMFIRRSMLEIPEAFWDGYGLDRMMHTQLASKGPISYIDKIMSVYRKHSFGLTAMPKDENKINSRYDKVLIIKDILPKGKKHLIKKMYVKHTYEKFKFYLYKKRYSDASKLLISTFFKYPIALVSKYSQMIFQDIRRKY